MPIPAGHLSGKCHLCKHPERVRAELLLAGGASINSVALKFGINRYAVGRHWANHVSDERRAVLVLGPVQRAALAARVAEESESVLDHHKVVRAGLYAFYDAAVTAGDRNGGALIAGRLTEVNNAIGRLTGELANSPLIQQNNFFAHDPGFAQFQADLVRVLSRFPDAYEAVLATFERLEQTPPSELLALEHHAEAG